MPSSSEMMASFMEADFTKLTTKKLPRVPASLMDQLSPKAIRRSESLSGSPNCSVSRRRRRSHGNVSLNYECGTDPEEQEVIIHQGWLTKRGGNFASWRRRWFVLRGDIIFYFREIDDAKHLGEIPLSGNVVRRVDQGDMRAPSKYLFEISPGEGSEGFARDRGNYLLSASNLLDMDEWLTKINFVISQQSQCMFKQTISETVSRERTFQFGGVVPMIVLQCCTFLRQHGIKEVGLFRQPGRANRIKYLQEKYDKSKYPPFGTPVDTDVHTVASLLKLYLRSIPEPVIPQEFNDCFVAATRFYKESDPAEAIQVVKGQLKGLPDPSYDCLKYVCRFLHAVQEHSDSNKMDCSNLAVVFGPNILRSNAEEGSFTDIKEMMKVVKDTSTVNDLTRILIEHSVELFPQSDDKSAVFTEMSYENVSRGVSGSFPLPECSSHPVSPRASITSASAAAAVLNPCNDAHDELLHFSSSSDDEIVPVPAPIKPARSVSSEVGVAPKGPSEDGVHFSDSLVLSPPGMGLDSGGALDFVVTLKPDTIGNGQGTADQQRLAEYSQKLDEMKLELDRYRQVAAEAKQRATADHLAAKAWELRYNTERKARQAVESRSRDLEKQLDMLFKKHYPV